MTTTSSSMSAPSAEDLRLSALDQAARTAPSGSTPQYIVKAAEAFLDFLTGTEKAEGAAAAIRAADLERIVSSLDRRGHYAAAGFLRDTWGQTPPKPAANTVHVHFDRPASEDLEREPGEQSRRKRLVRDIVKALRAQNRRWPGAAEYLDAVFGETR